MTQLLAKKPFPESSQNFPSGLAGFGRPHTWPPLEQGSYLFLSPRLLFPDHWDSVRRELWRGSHHTVIFTHINCGVFFFFFLKAEVPV